MRKIFVLFKREYLTAVKTKSFIISLVLVPVIMAGSFITFMVMENNQDTTDKKFVVIDHSGIIADYLQDQAELRNKNAIFDQETGEKNLPAYIIEIEQPDAQDPVLQLAELSDRIRDKELQAVIEIGKDVLHPSDSTEEDYIRYYAETGFMDNVRGWFNNTINNHLRQLRVEELNLDPEVNRTLFAWTNIEGMGLAEIDKKTGETREAESSNELQSFLVPYAMVILMFMLTLMSAVPLLSSVMEEKSEKIAEVLLGHVTPFQFMAGKVLGGVGVGLTIAAVYILGAVVTVSQLGVSDVIPMEILPWFFVYLLLYILMVGSGMAALGATCNDNKDVQSIQFPAMLPVIFPMFVIVPIISNPAGPFATTLALIPPFTPTVMMIRMATPVTLPVWQPILGLVLVLLFTIFSIWVGARIFRTAILVQGQKPSFGNLFRYAFKN